MKSFSLLNIMSKFEHWEVIDVLFKRSKNIHIFIFVLIYTYCIYNRCNFLGKRWITLLIAVGVFIFLNLRMAKCKYMHVLILSITRHSYFWCNAAIIISTNRTSLTFLKQVALALLFVWLGIRYLLAMFLWK